MELGGQEGGSGAATESVAGGNAASGEMEYRQLGRTTLRVSVIGYGAAPLGNVYATMEPEEAHAAVGFAIDRGINFFDVSPYYGLTLAETRLGETLAGRRGEVVLATKCGRYGGDEFDFSAERITQGVEESLGRLKTDWIDLLQAHDTEFGEVGQIVGETIPAMRRLQEQGKVRYIGITGYSLRNLMEIAAAAEVDTILSYCRYNLMITDMEETLLPFVQERGIGLINASPMHMGILTAQGAQSWHPAPAEVRSAGQRVVALCRERGVDAAAVALRFCLDHPAIASTLVGMATKAQVEANLKTLQMTTDPELLAEIGQVVAPVFDLTWPSGRAENHG